MTEMAIILPNRHIVNKIQMKWQRVPFESGDLGQNGVFEENGTNGGQSANCQKCNKMAKGPFWKTYNDKARVT